MSLRESILQLKPSESFFTDAERASIYTAAKRAGVSITTTATSDGRIEVTRKGGLLSLVDQIAALLPKDRLALFERFELCCGMNRGECVCEPDYVPHYGKPVEFETGYQESGSMDVGNVLRPNRQAKLEGLRSLMQNAGVVETHMANPKAGETDSRSEPVETWRFTSDKPQFADDGNVYRQQYCGKKRRSVQVDADDHELILSL